ncbi:Rap1a/Tai family immunity protein [Erythrobacter donghaensis]|uniref:Rap1a/Tai family immunity protein n=1 Tax=Erythrobacter donghaensis TaxID=267135 RepID=UPI000938BCB6|nr:Rap1a/Tai family immunity protein [Erythrobacter donghaensis]
MSRRRGTAIASLAAASLALLAAAPARAQASGAEAVAGFESAGNLLRKCRENSSFARSFCFAYLGAVADAARSYRVWIGSGDPCLPAGLTMGRLADTFTAYLVANPSLTEAQAASVIVASLQEAFPCEAPVSPAPAAPVLPSPEQPDDPIDRGPQADRQPQQ